LVLRIAPNQRLLLRYRPLSSVWHDTRPNAALNVSDSLWLNYQLLAGPRVLAWLSLFDDIAVSCLFSRILILPIVNTSSDCLKGSSFDTDLGNTLRLITTHSDCIHRRSG
jgi:hypothetical protein